MIRIGLTGGIGSGKTVVSTLLGVMGIPVYDSDDRTKELYDSDESLKAALTARFGESLYAEGRLNRSLLASIIFTDIEALSFINKVVHPIVEADYRKWAEQKLHMWCRNRPFCLKRAWLRCATSLWWFRLLMIYGFNACANGTGVHLIRYANGCSGS